MLVPTEPKIYHIVHFDRLASIAADGHIWCDAKVARDGAPGTTIGMKIIKHSTAAEIASAATLGCTSGTACPSTSAPAPSCST